VWWRRARAATLALAASGAGAVTAQDWFPTPVDVWDPPFQASAERSQANYVPLEKAEKPWRLVVFIPHLKDAYWLGVNYGLVAEARRLGVTLSIFEAGGYEHLDVQRAQIETALAGDEVDGLIVGAISLDGLNDLVAKASAKGLPVLDLINGISSPRISARAAASFHDMGFQTGSYLRRLARERKETVQVAWFPGPEGAGWVAAGDEGFRKAIAGQDIEILVSAHADTGKYAQAGLIEKALDEHGETLDYVVGTAVTAEVAVGILRQRELDERIGVLSYYYGPAVHRGIARGEILAAPSDCPATQARIAVDVIVRILEEREFLPHVAPRIQVIDAANIREWDSSSSIAPRGFRPTFRVNE